jgi:hypothetical protein
VWDARKNMFHVASFLHHSGAGERRWSIILRITRRFRSYAHRNSSRFQGYRLAD